MEHINITTIHRISWLGRTIGMLMTIVGVFLIIRGLVTTFADVIPGMVTVLLGQFILSTGRYAKQAVATDDQNALNGLLRSYSRFLLTNGIIMTVVIIFYIIYFIMTID